MIARNLGRIKLELIREKVLELTPGVTGTFPGCRNAGTPERRNAGTPERRNAGTPERRNAGPFTSRPADR
jgi:hypothetical protein